MLALPMSIVSTNFSIYYSYAKARAKIPPKKKVKAGVEANNFPSGTYQAIESQSQNRLGVNKIGIEISPMGTPVTPFKTPKFDEHLSPHTQSRIRIAVERMKVRGIIKSHKKKDFAAVVVALSSKGDWELCKERFD